jgi:hypothetical protein
MPFSSIRAAAPSTDRADQAGKDERWPFLGASCDGPSRRFASAIGRSASEMATASLCPLG